MNINFMQVTKYLAGLLASTVMLLSLTGCMSTELPRDNDETGKLSEVTVYDISQNPRVPITGAWVLVEYRYVTWGGLVEGRQYCRISYSVKSDAKGRIYFPERTKHALFTYPFMAGFEQKQGQQRDEIILHPVTRTREEEFRFFIIASNGTDCYDMESKIRQLDRRKYFFELAKTKVNLANREESYLFQRNQESIAKLEAEALERVK